MLKTWLLLDPSEDELSGGGGGEATATVDAPSSATTQTAESTASTDNPSTSDVMAEFAAEGLLPEPSTEKRELPKVEHPQTKPGATPKPPVAATQDKSKVAPKTEEKKEDKKEEAATEDIFEQLRKHKEGTDKQQPTTQTQQQQASKQKGPQGRNYEQDLPKELHALAKNMSNDAYAKFVEVVKENNTLKSDKTVKTEAGVPVSYYEHPDSYLLSPEFSEVTSNIQQANLVLAHWEQQKARILAGEDWQDLDVDENGKIVLGQKMTANEDAKIKIGQYIQHAAGQRKQMVQAANQIKTTFVEKTKQVRQWLGEQEDKHLPWFKDPKYEGWEIAKEVFKALPSELRHSPLASTVAKLTAVNRTSMGYNKMLLSENQTLRQQIAALTGGKGVNGAPNNGTVIGTQTSGGSQGNNGLKAGDVDVKEIEKEFEEFLG